MDLSLRLLRTLAAVAEHGSMTRAARQLNLTQQAVSSQIRQLERVVGTALVDRLPTGIELTSAGQVVLKQGEALLLAAQAMAAEAQVAGASGPKPLRIAFKAQSTAHFMPEVEAALRRQAPGLEVRPIASHTLPDELDALLESAPTPRSCGFRSATILASRSIRCSRRSAGWHYHPATRWPSEPR